MKKKFTLIIMIMGIFLYADSSDAVVEKFFDMIEKQQYEKAIVETFMDTYNDLGMSREYDSVKTEMSSLITQFEQVGQSYGASLGYDVIVEKSLGKKYKRVKYILYFETQPIEVQIALYAPRGDWGIRNISMSTYITDDFATWFDAVYE